MRRVQGINVGEGFKDGWLRLHSLVTCCCVRHNDDLVKPHHLREKSRPFGQDGWDTCARDYILAHLYLHPGASGAAIVDHVIEQSRVAAGRDAQASGAEVAFCCDGILLVAQIVCHICRQFDQHHAHVGRASLCPLRHGRAHAIQHQLAKTGVVLRHVVDVGNDLRFRDA